MVFEKKCNHLFVLKKNACISLLHIYVEAFGFLDRYNFYFQNKFSRKTFISKNDSFIYIIICNI